MATIDISSTEGLINYKNCKKQGDIYEYAANEGYDIEQFSKLYMNSSFCENSFDKCWCLYHLADPYETFLEMLLPEFGDKLTKHKEGEYFNQDIAWWIGFTYRQLCVETVLPSKEIYKAVSFEELVNAYPGLHTIDEEYATDTICEFRNLIKYPKKEIPA